MRPDRPEPPCLVCDLRGYTGKIVKGQTPTLDRRLCPPCQARGFELERGGDWTGTIVTPEGLRVVYNLSKPKAVGTTRLRRLRESDTTKIPGTEGLFMGKARLR